MSIHTSQHSRLRAILTAIAVSAGLLSLGASGVAVPASAASDAKTPRSVNMTYEYPVYEYKVCNLQGHFGASFSNPWNPYSWYCYDLSIPFGVTFAGGLDVQNYCNVYHPGSRATATKPTAAYDSWKCIKRV